MLTISVPGYRTFLQNRVYVKPLAHSRDKQLPHKKTILPNIYTAINEDDVAQYIRRKCVELITKASPEKLSPLEQQLRTLEEQKMRKIVEADAEVMDIIRKGTSARYSRDEIPRKYLRVIYGILPHFVFEKLGKDETAHKQELYKLWLEGEFLIKKGMGKKWQADIRVYDDNLPDFDDISTILRYGMVQGDAITISADRPHFEEIIDVLANLYEGLGCGEKLELLRDVTNEDLELACISPIMKLKDILNS